jgi:hypothetical protein
MPRSHHWTTRPTPTGRSSLVHHQSSSTHHHMCLLKQKRQVFVFAKRIKGRPAQKLPPRWRDDELVIAIGPPLRHLQCWDDVTVLDIVVIDRARHGEYQWLLAGLPDKVHPGLISEVVHLVVVPPDTLLLYIHHVREHSQCQQRPSSQRTRIHGRSVVTYVAGWALGGRWAGHRDGVVVGCCAKNNPRVADVGDDHEVPLLDDGQRGAAALDHVQVAAASELVVHSGACRHVGLLLEVKLTVIKLLLIIDERRQRERLLLVVFVWGFQVRNTDSFLALVYENDSQVRSMEKILRKINVTHVKKGI